MDQWGGSATHFDLALLGDGAPVPGGYAAAPVELERDGDGRAVVGRPEAGEVVAGLGGREGEVARVHVLRVVQAVAVGRGDPQRDAVRVRELLLLRRRQQGRGAVVGGHDVVLADGHGADLDVVGDALGVARKQVEAEGAGGERGREDEEEERREGPVVDARGHGGWIVGAPRWSIEGGERKSGVEATANGLSLLFFFCY